MAPFKRYWLFDWLDEAGIRKPADAPKALASKTNGYKRLLELSREAAQALWSPSSGEGSIVAGTGTDLTGNLGCYDAKCRKKDVDELFTKGWHYFDRIVVADEITGRLAHHEEELDDECREAFLRDLEMILYVREIGAENFLDFRAKHSPNWTHLKQLGQRPTTAIRQMGLKIESILAQEADISKDGDHWYIHHPMLGHSQWIDSNEVGAKSQSESQTRKAVARRVVRRFSAYLLADLELAQRSGMPLGLTNAVHGAIMQCEKPGVQDVAFSFEFPFLAGVPIKELLKLRADEAESFSRFRDSVRLAAKERLRNSDTPQRQDIAVEIVQDLIEPELRTIRSRLSSAKVVLAKQLGTNVAIGGFVTTCGILVGLGAGSLLQSIAPAAVAGGLYSVKGAGSALTWFIRENRDVELSDMFFLWNAIPHDARTSL